MADTALARTTRNTTLTTGYPVITEALEARFIAFLDVKPKSLDTYRKGVKQLLSYLSLNGVVNPQREDILAYRDYLKESHKPTTVQNYITIARLFFQWTEQEGIYPNVAEHVKGATLDRNHKKDALTSGQVKAILAKMERQSLKGKRNYAMFTLMVTCGLRTIEVSRANIEDLRTEAGNPVLFIQGKGREEKSDYVKLPQPVEEAIRDYLADRGAKDPTAPLFTSLSNNSTENRITTRSISAVAKEAMQKAGYSNDRLTAHSLRHTAVTLALLGGEDITEVQKFARHANINTTMIYNHAIDQAKNTCSNAVASAIF